MLRINIVPGELDTSMPEVPRGQCALKAHALQMNLGTHECSTFGITRAALAATRLMIGHTSSYAGTPPKAGSGTRSNSQITPAKPLCLNRTTCVRVGAIAQKYCSIISSVTS